MGEPGPAAREGEGALNENERDELNRLRKEECRAGDGARCAQALGPLWVLSRPLIWGLRNTVRDG